VLHGAVDRPSKPRSTQTNKKPQATQGSTVPRVQFLRSWTARDRRLFATIRKIVRMTLHKRFGPSVFARAKSAFHLKDPSLGLNLRRIKSSKNLSDYRAIGPVTISQRRCLKRLSESLKVKLREWPTSCDACGDELWPSGWRSGTELDPRRRRWFER
jgi:hypothetical protein